MIRSKPGSVHAVASLPGDQADTAGGQGPAQEEAARLGAPRHVNIHLYLHVGVCRGLRSYFWRFFGQTLDDIHN